jgi:hypothetical protein
MHNTPDSAFNLLSQIMRTMLKCAPILAALAPIIDPAPTSAALITNTFTGTVTATGPSGFATRPDAADQFGFFPNGYLGQAGVNLTGDSFTLTTTLDTSLASANSFQGGSTYGSASPLTATLTINGNSFVFNTSNVLQTFFPLNSFGNTNPGNNLQESIWFNRNASGGSVEYASLFIDFNANGVPSFTTQLPRSSSR